MQGTQYAPRESILCVEHFVALQCRLRSDAIIEPCHRMNVASYQGQQVSLLAVESRLLTTLKQFEPKSGPTNRRA